MPILQRKLIYTSILLSASLYANDTLYKGCGLNEAEARLNLANNISTNIESTTFLNKSNKSILGIDLFSKSFTKNSKQSTNLALRDIDIIKEDKNICATISSDKLYNLTKDLISKVTIYSETSLPKYEKEKVIKISEILTDIKNTIVLVGVFQNKFPKDTTENLHKKEKLFINLRNKYNAQYAKVTVVGKYDKIIIDGTTVDQNKEVFLKSGTHKYEVISSNHCPVEGEFHLNRNKDFETVVNMSNYNFPYIIITSNKPNAILKLNNEKKSLEKKHIRKTCDSSELAYSISYNNQIKKGTLRLSPNASIEKDFTFYSKDELNKFVNLAESYDEKKRFEIKYGYMAVSLLEDYEDYEDINTIQLNYVSSYKAFKFGYGAVYGKGEYSEVYELYYNLGVQITSINDNTVVRVGPVVIVPSLTAQIGFGKHNLYNTVSEEFKSDMFNEEGEESFMDDYVVLKANFGLDFIVNENVGINIFAQQQFTMEKAITFGAGLSVTF